MSSSFFDNLNPVKHLISRVLDNKYVNSQGISTANLTKVHLKNLSLNTFHINKDLLSFSPLRLESAVIGEFQVALQSMSVIKVHLKDLRFKLFCNEDVPPNAFMEDFVQRMAYLSTEEARNSASRSKSFNATILNLFSRFTISVIVERVHCSVRLTRPIFQAESLACPLHSVKCPDHSLQFRIDTFHMVHKRVKAGESCQFEMINPDGSDVPKKGRNLRFKLRIKGLSCYREVTSPLVKLNGKVKRLPLLLADPTISGEFTVSCEGDAVSTGLRLKMKDLALLVDSHNVGFLTALILKIGDFTDAALALKNLNSFKEENDLSSQNQSIIYRFNQSLLDHSELGDKSFANGDQIEFFNSKMDDSFLQQSKSIFRKTKTNCVLEPEPTEGLLRVDDSAGNSPQHSQMDISRLEKKAQQLLLNEHNESSLSLENSPGADILRSSVSKQVYTRSFSEKQTLNRSSLSDAERQNHFSKKKPRAQTSCHKFGLTLESLHVAFVCDGITSDLNDLLGLDKPEGFLRIGPLSNVQLLFEGISVKSSCDVRNQLDGSLFSRDKVKVKVRSAEARVFHEVSSGNAGSSVHNFSASFSLNLNSFDSDKGQVIFKLGEPNVDDKSQCKDILKGLNATDESSGQDKTTHAESQSTEKAFLDLSIHKDFDQDTPAVTAIFTETIQANVNSILLVADMLKEALGVEKDYFQGHRQTVESLEKQSIRLLKQEKTLYFENFDKTDLSLLEEWITKFLAEFTTSRPTLVDLLQSIQRLHLSRLVLGFVSKSSAFELRLDALSLTSGDPSTSPSTRNPIDRHINDIIEINDTEMKDCSIYPQREVKVSLGRAELDYFRHHANPNSDLRVSLVPVNVIILQKLLNHEPIFDVNVRVGQVRVKSLFDGLLSLVDQVLAARHELEDLFGHSQREWAGLKSFFWRKFQKLYLDKDLVGVHEKLKRVVALVLRLDEPKTRLNWIVKKVYWELSTGHKDATDAQISFKKKNCVDMTFLLDNPHKQATQSSRTAPKPPVFRVMLELKQFSGMIDQIERVDQIRASELELRVAENRHSKIFDCLVHLRLNRLWLETANAESRSTLIKVADGALFVDLFETRIDAFCRSIQKILKEVKTSCKTLTNLIVDSVNQDQPDSPPPAQSDPFDLEHVIVEPANFTVVLNDYSFTYQAQITQLSLASGTLSVTRATLHRISFLDSAISDATSLWKLQHKTPPAQILAVDNFSFKIPKFFVNVEAVSANLPLHVIKELDCYSAKVDFLILKLDTLLKSFAHSFASRVAESEICSIYEDVSTGSVQTEYKSILSSYLAPGARLEESAPESPREADLDHSFELIVPSFKQVFSDFEEFVHNSNSEKEGGGSGISIRNLKDFCSKQNTQMRRVLRVFVVSVRFKIQMLNEYFSLTARELFYNEVELPTHDFPSTQSILQVSSFAFKNVNQDMPLLTSSPDHVSLNLFLSRGLHVDQVQFAVHLFPVNFYLAHIRQVFPQIYDFLLFLQTSSESSRGPRPRPPAKFPQLQSSIVSSVNFIKSRFVGTEESAIEESLHNLLTSSLSTAQGFELVPFEVEERPETRFTDFRVSPVRFRFFKQSSSLECIEIVTRGISPENDIKFDQSAQSLVRLIVSSIKADLWTNKAKLWNLRTLNFVLLLLNVASVILSKSQPTKKFKSFSKQSIKKIRKRALKLFKNKTN